MFTSEQHSSRLLHRGVQVHCITHWDAFFSSAWCEVPQSKSSKLKYAVFMAGKDRLTDWMLDYGDYLVMDKGRTTYDPNGSNFLIPEIAGSGAGTKLTAVLKGIQPEGCKGSMPTYADFRVTSLPTELSAGGLRHGACDMLATVMPAELGASAST